MTAVARKPVLPRASAALPGRADAMPVAPVNIVTGKPTRVPAYSSLQQCCFGMGYFWGFEPLFWGLPGVYSTAVGYSGGFTPNPNFEEVCSGGTGHAEVVLVIYDPSVIEFEQLLALFWDSHDPTQGMRQGVDKGTQFRSAIYTNTESQTQLAELSRGLTQQQLSARGFGKITTEIRQSVPFYFAEDYHQQYLQKNPNGYCSRQGLDRHSVWTVPNIQNFAEARA